MLYRQLILGAGLFLAITSCTNIKHNVGNDRWFNASLPVHLQHTFYQQEQAFCTQAADQWIPIPDVHFSFQGVRYINGRPNVSVEGANTTIAAVPVQHSALSQTILSEVGLWKTLTADAVKGHRESRDERQCMTALGWTSTADTWDGTPDHMNESIAVNKAVMAAVKEGFSHPLLGDRVIALLDLRESAKSDSGAVVTATIIPLFDPANPSVCVYEITQSWLSDQAMVSCDEGGTQLIGIQSKSPIDMWLAEYF